MDEAHIRISPILKTSVFQNVGDQRGIGHHPTTALTEGDTVAKLTLKKKIAEMSIWHENELTIAHNPLPQFLTPWNQHNSIFVRSTSVLQCRGPSSSPFVITLLSSDLIASVQTFLS